MKKNVYKVEFNKKSYYTKAYCVEDAYWSIIEKCHIKGTVESIVNNNNNKMVIDLYK